MTGLPDTPRTDPAAAGLPALPAQGWLLIFTDIVALLLTFFVMLYAMKQVEVDKFQAFVGTLSPRLAPVTGRADVAPPSSFNTRLMRPNEATHLDYVAGVVRAKLSLGEADSALALDSFDDRLVVSIDADLLFVPSGPTLTDGGRARLADLAGVLATLDNEVVVHGVVPGYDAGGAPGIGSAWELALARADAVAAAFRLNGYRPAMARFGRAGLSAPGRIEIVIRAPGDTPADEVGGRAGSRP